MNLPCGKYHRGIAAKENKLFKKFNSYEVFMFKRLLTLLTGLTATVFFTQSSIAAETLPVEKPKTEQVLNKKQKAKNKEEYKKRQNQVNAKKKKKK